MKSFTSRWLASALLAATVAVAAGCGGGGGDSATPAPTPNPAPAPAPAPAVSQTVSDRGIVTGKVVDPTGAAVGSTQVTLGGTTVTSNEQGFFVIENVAPGANQTITLGKSGFMPGQSTVTVVGGQNSFLNLTIKQVGVARGNLSAATQQVVTDTRSDGRNGSVTIPANAVVDTAGRPVSTYTVELTTLVPGDPAFTSVFPGRFLGGTTAGTTANPGLLQSFGVVQVDLKDAQGNALRLAQGARATLTFPIGTATGADPGDASVPLWSLDPATGIWIQEGSATRSGSTYVAQVAHFSPWNIDKLIFGPAIKEVRVRGLGDVPVPNALVTVEGTGYRQIANTGSDGVAILTVVPGDTIRVSAQRGSIQSAVTTETAPGSGVRLVNTVALVDPLVTVMMSWGRNPSDLDAHLNGPSNRHVWYRSRGSLLVEPFAQLDTDDVTSFGPEIVTITQLFAGTYRFSVHNYSSQATFAMENSQAVINLVIPRSGVIRRYDIPTVNPLGVNGNQWVVFELNVDANGAVTVVDVSQYRQAGLDGSDIR